MLRLPDFYDDDTLWSRTRVPLAPQSGITPRDPEKTREFMKQVREEAEAEAGTSSCDTFNRLPAATRAALAGNVRSRGQETSPSRSFGTGLSAEEYQRVREALRLVKTSSDDAATSVNEAKTAVGVDLISLRHRLLSLRPELDKPGTAESREFLLGKMRELRADIERALRDRSIEHAAGVKLFQQAKRIIRKKEMSLQHRAEKREGRTIGEPIFDNDHSDVGVPVSRQKQEIPLVSRLVRWWNRKKSPHARRKRRK